MNVNCIEGLDQKLYAKVRYEILKVGSSSPAAKIVVV